MKTDILSWDTECGTTKLQKRGASYLAPENYMVAIGFKVNGEDTFGSYFNTESETQANFKFPDLSSIGTMVLQNAKFDLLWTWQNQDLQQYIKDGGKIWCTQLAEYLIEGMVPSSHMASMNQMVEKYGGTLKMDAVKELWESGVDTPDIPRDLLMKYLLGSKEDELDGDVNNTYLIYQGQLKRIAKMHPNSMQMILNRMESLLATSEMEFNGLCIDTVLGDKLREEVKAKVLTLDADLLQYIPELPPELKFNWSSIYHKSYLIYGGTAKYLKWEQHLDDETDEPLWIKKAVPYYRYGEKTVPSDYSYKGVFHNPYDDNFIGLMPDTYKSGARKGQLKFRTKTILGALHDPYSDDFLGLQPDKFTSGKRVGEFKTTSVAVSDYSKPKGAKKPQLFTFKGYTKPSPEWASTLTDGKDKPIFSTSADIIDILSTRSIPFLINLSKRQKLSKDLGTYYWDEKEEGGVRTGMLTLVNECTGCIHHALNHTQTVTGRMSSSNPNGQNIPRKDSSDIKQVFISRFGESGRIVELDYSSLEVVVQAYLTGDKQLIIDLNNGVDFHCKRLAKKLGRGYAELKAILDDDTHPEHKSIKLQRTKIKEFTFQRALT